MPPSITPSTLSRRQKRKGIPSKAPTRSPLKPSSSSDSPKVIKASLLLLALIREAKRTPTATSNHRFSASATGLNKPVHRKREREILPPALPGYGRGQRSASVAVSEGGRYAKEASPAPSSTSAFEENGNGRRAKPLPIGLSIGGTGTRLKRASSIEPIASTSHSIVSDQNLLSVSSRNMTRASSVGPGSHHHHHHHSHAPVHSPLARSFSFDGKRERSVSANGTHANGNANGRSHLNAEILPIRESSSRKVDAPHHLHAYDMQYIPA